MNQNYCFKADTSLLKKIHRPRTLSALEIRAWGYIGRDKHFYDNKFLATSFLKF